MNNNTTKIAKNEALTAKTHSEPSIDDRRTEWLENVKKITKEIAEFGFNKFLDNNLAQTVQEELVLLDHKDQLKYFINLQIDKDKDTADLKLFTDLRKKCLDHLNEWKDLYPEKAVVDELNAEYAFLSTKGNSYVLIEEFDANLNLVDFYLSDEKFLKNVYAPHIIKCSDGKPRTKNKIWWCSPKRREFKRLVFDVQTPRKKLEANGSYNMYRGFAFIAKKGDCSLFWAHALHNICSGDPEVFKYLKDWLAYCVQNPDLKLPALILLGEQGVGKSFAAEHFGKLLGRHFLNVESTDHVFTRFNSITKLSLLILIAETDKSSDYKKFSSKYKTAVTSPEKTIEEKNREPYQVPNFTKYIYTSNEKTAVALDRDDRRSLVLHVPPNCKNNRPYFKKIEDQLKNGGYEALLYELQATDLTNFDPWNIPQTIAKLDSKIESATLVEQYAIYMVKENTQNLSDQGDVEKGKDDIYNDFRDLFHSYKNTIHKAQFFKDFRVIFPSIADKRTTKNNKRTYALILPGISKLTDDLCKYFETTIAILMGHINR